MFLVNFLKLQKDKNNDKYHFSHILFFTSIMYLQVYPYQLHYFTIKFIHLKHIPNKIVGKCYLHFKITQKSLISSLKLKKNIKQLLLMRVNISAKENTLVNTLFSKNETNKSCIVLEVLYF